MKFFEHNIQVAQSNCVTNTYLILLSFYLLDKILIFQDFGVEIVADYMNGEELEYGGTVEVEADAEGRETAARQTEAEADYAEESSELTAMQVQHHRELNPRLNAIIITWNSLTTSKLQDVIQTPDI